MFAKDSTLPDPKRLQNAVAVAVLAGALLAGCSPAPEPTQDIAQESGPGTTQDAGAQTTQADATPPSIGETIGGDGSDIQLDALTGSDLSGANLPGELACSFSAGDALPMLHAMGIVASDEPAQGIVKVSGYVEPIRAPGGFDGMLRDPTFTGQGRTIRIVATGPATGGGESPPVPATLTYQRADGASRTYDGQWRCGP